ncbi:XkdX family protein [Lactobacillus crispatus]|nr:XkdX family protein [Lactobacillus crispatus]
MFEIYKMEFDIGIVTAVDLKSYIGMGILSQPDYERIVGDESHEESNSSPEVQA